jgi:hypothetical protein
MTLNFANRWPEYENEQAVTSQAGSGKTIQVEKVTVDFERWSINVGK